MKKVFYIFFITLCVSFASVAFAGGSGDGEAVDTGKPLQSSGALTEQPAAQESGGKAIAHAERGSKKIIVARVNGVGINMRSLINLMNTMSARQGKAERTTEEKNTLRKKGLDRLIFEELAYQEATADGIKADPAEVEKDLQDLKIKLGGPEGFKEQLERDDATEEEVRAEIARTKVLQRIFEKEIYNKVTVSDDDIKRAYEKGKKEKFTIPEKVVVDDIVFFLDTEKEESMQKAQKVLMMIKNGPDKDPRKLVPDGTFIVKEGELIRKAEPQLYDEAKKLKPGELSGVIRGSDSLHILKLEQYTPERQLSMEEMKGYIEAELRSAAQVNRLHEWEKELKKGAAIEIFDTGEGGQLPAQGK